MVVEVAMGFDQAVNAMLHGHMVTKVDGPTSEHYAAVKSGTVLCLYRLTGQEAELWLPTHQEVLEDQYLLSEPPRQLKCAPGCFDIVTAVKLLKQGYGVTRSGLEGVLRVRGNGLTLDTGQDFESYTLGLNDLSARDWTYDSAGAAKTQDSQQQEPSHG